MSKLTENYKETFKRECSNQGFSVEQNENTFVAVKNNIFIKLEIVRELFGNSHVAISTLTIICGDFEKALLQENMILKAENKISKGIYDFYPDFKGEIIDTTIVNGLDKIKSIAMEIQKTKDYILFSQKGTHDLILKDPVSVQFLRGKIGIEELIEIVKQLNVPYGRIIQKPKGLGDKKVVERWKKISVWVVILSFFVLILIRLVNTLYN